MKYYTQTGSGYDVDKTRLIIRDDDNGSIQRYDIKTTSWITEYEMPQIFIGDIECEPIAEAKEIIARLS